MPVDLRYCQGMLSCERKIVILLIRQREIVVNTKISGI